MAFYEWDRNWMLSRWHIKFSEQPSMLNSKYFQKSFSEQFFVFRPIIYNCQERNGSFSHCQTELIILADSYEGAPNYEQHFFAAFFFLFHIYRFWPIFMIIGWCGKFGFFAPFNFFWRRKKLLKDKRIFLRELSSCHFMGQIL